MDDLTPEELANFSAFQTWLNNTTGMTPGGMNAMEYGDDWTFVIVIHAVIESVLNEAIIQTIGRPELADIISHVDLGNRQTGKLAWCKALGILTEENRSFLRFISSIRNDVAHQVRFFDFSFSKWIQELSPKIYKNFRDSLNEYLVEEIASDHQLAGIDETIKGRTRDVVMDYTMEIIMHLHSNLHSSQASVGIQESNPKEQEPPHLP